MTSYQVTLRYRLPPSPGRLDAAAMVRGLGPGYVTSARSDVVLEVVVRESGPTPSEAAAVTHRRLIDVWPQVWRGQPATPPGHRPVEPPAELPSLRSISWRDPAGRTGRSRARGGRPGSRAVTAGATRKTP